MENLPSFQTINNRTVLQVNDNPFFIVSVQLNCDSCYDLGRMIALTHQVAQLGCNTVALLLYWRQLDPEEGVFDDSILDNILSAAQAENIRIVLVWFGTYKNATMHYVPQWVLQDHRRFPRAVDVAGKEIPYVACPTSNETIAADKKAVCHVFEYLRVHDITRRVILFQVNNETGLLGGIARCHCERCQLLYESWSNAKSKDAVCDEEYFTAECILNFHEKIAKAAKEIYPLPSYLNAWLSKQSYDSILGVTYPAGGPNDHCLDLYVARKKPMDFVSPDIYDTGYKAFRKICIEYNRKDNPLYIAEHGAGSGSRAGKNIYYAIAEHQAIGLDLWAIDCSFPDIMEQPLCDPVTYLWSKEAYDFRDFCWPISNAVRPIMDALGTNRLKCWVQEESETSETIRFEDADVKVSSCNPKNGYSRGIVIRLSNSKYILLGARSVISFLNNQGKKIEILKAEQGIFKENIFCGKSLNTMAGQDHGIHHVFLREGGIFKVVLDVSDNPSGSVTDVFNLVTF